MAHLNVLYTKFVVFIDYPLITLSLYYVIISLEVLLFLLSQSEDSNRIILMLSPFEQAAKFCQQLLT